MKHRTLLCADDSPAIHRVVEMSFPETDVKVICVADGEAAIRSYRELKPDLVLLDASMPGRDGYEVCEFIKKRSGGGAPPVLLLSSCLEEFDTHRARAAHADGFMAKPFQSNVLREKVHALLGGPASSTIPGREAPRLQPEPLTPQTGAPVPSPPATEPDRRSAADAPRPPVHGTTLTKGDVELIVRRLTEVITPEVIRELSWEVLPDLVERAVKSRLG